MKEEKEVKKTYPDRKKKRAPKPATPERLEKAALHYLERYASSAENLRRVLMRRVQRSAQLHGTDPEAGAEAVQDLIDRYRRAGLLDDRAYATARAAGLHRQGKSLRAIRQTLSIKGVAEDVITQALEDLREEIGTANTDLQAAVNYARRRRIGPWRRGDRQEFKERDLAALGRQGFGYDIARKIIEADSISDFEEDFE